MVVIILYFKSYVFSDLMVVPIHPTCIHHAHSCVMFVQRALQEYGGVPAFIRNNFFVLFSPLESGNLKVNFACPG